MSNLGTLVSGTAVAQGLLLGSYPILTRLYSPDLFGVFGVVSAIMATVGVAATFRYELAIPLPKEDSDASALLLLSLVCSGLTAAAAAGLIALCPRSWLSRVLEPDLVPLLYWVPLGVLAIGAYQAGIYACTQSRAFRLSAAGQIARAAAIVGLQIGFGFAGAGVGGLIGGRVGGESAGAVVVGWRHVWRSLRDRGIRPIRRVLLVGRHYADFPLFSAPQGLLNSGSQHVPTLLLAYFYGPAMTGFFVVAVRVLQMPASVVKRGVMQVLLERFSRLAQGGEDPRPLYRRAVAALLVCGGAPLAIAGVAGPYASAWLLGDDWRLAGNFISLLCGWCVLWLASGPATVLLQVRRRQRQLLVYNVILFVTRVLALVTAGMYLGPAAAVGFYALVGALMNLGLILYADRQARTSNSEQQPCDG